MAGPSAQPSQAVVAAPAAGPSVGPSRRNPGRITPPIGEGLPIGTRSPGSGSASRQTAQPWRADGISAGMKETGSNGVPEPAGRKAQQVGSGRAGSRRQTGRPLPAQREDTDTARAGRPDTSVSRSSAGRQPQDRSVSRTTTERSRSGQVFEGIGRGSEVRRQSTWGRESLNAARSSGGTVGDAIRGGASGGAGRGAVAEVRQRVSGGAGRGAVGGGFGGSRGGHR